MRALLLTLLQVALLVLLLPLSNAHAQAPPADLKFSATVGGAAPWAEKARITIDNTGQATYFRYTGGDSPNTLTDTAFTVSADGLQQLWKAIQDNSFFATAQFWTDSTFQDGSLARITVTANGVSHQISAKNIKQPALEAILTVLNTVVPPSLQLIYTPPVHLDLVPKEPCESLFGFNILPPENQDMRLSSPDLKTRHWAQASISAVSSVAANGPSHPGVVVAYNMNLRDAIRRHYASVKSKGDFFGDDVSITVDDRRPPPSNTITITLYLEFYGSQATQANVNTAELDILKKWNGLKNSSGQTIEIKFSTRISPGATSPPNTPGYNEIEMVPKGAVRSYQNVAGVNQGTADGKWEVGQPAGTYAHEIGHLMGFYDRYVDWNKQADGSWVNSQTGDSYPNSQAFAEFAVTRIPGQTVSNLKNFYDRVDIAGIPNPGAGNDLMARVEAPVRQADIDQITANPGLLVVVPKGSVFSNRKKGQQNLIVMHADQVFAKPGERRTLNGLYAACIDHSSGIPDSNVVMDVTPPVSEWSGIAAAGYMAQLLEYVDSAALYCGSQFSAQEAIWRISDNTLPVAGGSVQALLMNAGINLGDQLLDFPRLLSPEPNDTTSLAITPNELYVADIRPRFASGQAGAPVGFTVHLSSPQDEPAPKILSWTAAGPHGGAATITGADSSASLTPVQSGIYQVALNLSVSDSVLGSRTFPSVQKAYAIVPDNFTETFEHAGLTDRFPWKSLGDVPWKISDVDPQTGSFSAKAGDMAAHQRSTLAIDVSVPADTAIYFSTRVLNSGFLTFAFYIDSAFAEFLPGVTDWQVHRHTLRKGNHILAWTVVGDGTPTGSNVWLDNIFFPGNVVVTSAGAAPNNIPTVFSLDQNYPNPFNPLTVIRYGLPHRSSVSLTVYNELGQKVADLVGGIEEAGYHEVKFDGSRFASGVYFYTLKADQFTQTRKLLLVK